MDSANFEESTSLTPKGQQGKSSRSMLQYNREKRIRLIRLRPIYYFTWILLIILSSLILPYLYIFFPEPACWNARKMQINFSLVLAIMTTIGSLLLLFIQCFTRVKTTQFRRNFCRSSFILFTFFSILNFIITIYFFNMFSCYFDQLTPDEELDKNNDWFTNLTIKYDLKMVAVIHLVCSLLAFFTGIGFAIIKNNFKYVLRVDIN